MTDPLAYHFAEDAREDKHPSEKDDVCRKTDALLTRIMVKMATALSVYEDRSTGETHRYRHLAKQKTVAGIRVICSYY